MITPTYENYLYRSAFDLARSPRRRRRMAAITILAGLMMLVGTTFAGHDWNTGSMSNQLLFEPRRLRVWAAKGLAVAADRRGARRCRAGALLGRRRPGGVQPRHRRRPGTLGGRARDAGARGVLVIAIARTARLRPDDAVPQHGGDAVADVRRVARRLVGGPDRSSASPRPAGCSRPTSSPSCSAATSTTTRPRAPRVTGGMYGGDCMRTLSTMDGGVYLTLIVAGRRAPLPVVHTAPRRALSECSVQGAVELGGPYSRRRVAL